VRVALFELGPQGPDYLLIIIHHLAGDGVSWRILQEHLDVLYNQLSHNQVVQLPPKTTSCKDPGPEGPALVQPRGVKGVITVTGGVQVSGFGCQVSAKEFDPLDRSRP
jgi:hypothetical protein